MAWSEQDADKTQCIIAILNDSWEVLTLVGPLRGVCPLSPVRIAIHDIIALVICVAGIILLLFSGSGLNGFSQALDGGSSESQGGGSFSEENMTMAALWSLVAVV